MGPGRTGERSPPACPSVRPPAALCPPVSGRSALPAQRVGSNPSRAAPARPCAPAGPGPAAERVSSAPAASLLGTASPAPSAAYAGAPRRERAARRRSPLLLLPPPRCTPGTAGGPSRSRAAPAAPRRHLPAAELRGEGGPGRGGGAGRLRAAVPRPRAWRGAGEGRRRRRRRRQGGGGEAERKLAAAASSCSGGAGPQPPAGGDSDSAARAPPRRGAPWEGARRTGGARSGAALSGAPAGLRAGQRAGARPRAGRGQRGWAARCAPSLRFHPWFPSRSRCVEQSCQCLGAGGDGTAMLEGTTPRFPFSPWDAASSVREGAAARSPDPP